MENNMYNIDTRILISDLMYISNKGDQNLGIVGKHLLKLAKDIEICEETLTAREFRLEYLNLTKDWVEFIESSIVEVAKLNDKAYSMLLSVLIRQMYTYMPAEKVIEYVDNRGWYSGT